MAAVSQSGARTIAEGSMAAVQRQAQFLMSVVTNCREWQQCDGGQHSRAVVAAFIEDGVDVAAASR